MSSIFGNAQGMQSAVVTLQQACRPEMVNVRIEKRMRAKMMIDDFDDFQAVVAKYGKPTEGSERYLLFHYVFLRQGRACV